MGSLSDGEVAGAAVFDALNDRTGHGAPRKGDDPMLRITQRAVTLLTLLTLPPAVLADSIYIIKDYPELQNGWTLSGTITTDGRLGPIGPNDITSWEWTVTSGEGTHTNKSTDRMAGIWVSGGGTP